MSVSDAPDGDAADVDPSAIYPASPDDVARHHGDDAVAGTVEMNDGTNLTVALDDDLVEAARDADVDVDRLKAAAVPDDMNFAWSSSTEATAQQDTSATVPVQSEHFADFGRHRRDRDSAFIQDEQIQRLRRNSINYNHRIGRWLLRQDDLIPSVKERLKALIVGEDGLSVEPKDPDSDADQRLAEHLRDIYGGDVRPNQVIDAILRENLMNARAVLRSTDLAELDLTTLKYVKDGITGEEIYVQRNTAVHTFEIDQSDGDRPGIDIQREQIDEQPLVIGDQVFDISLYDSPPLEGVADTAVNKMVLQRLKARKAEITSFGAVYASVEAPSYLPEEQYFDRVQDDDFDGDDPPTKLERALKSNLQKAFDTLKDFQSGTVMAVPDYWTLEQLEMPETTESLDDQIRGYNQDISRRMLVPLDLIELREGAELSRDTLFRTLMTTIAGWRREIIRIFDAFADVQADIQGVDGSVEHQFPALHDQDEAVILDALNHAGVAGLTEKEVRQMLNGIQGVDLQTDEPATSDEFDDLPPEGGPEDADERGEQMAQFMAEQRRGRSGSDDQDPSDAPLEAQDDFQATVFRVVAPDDEADRYDDPVLGIGVDFPNSDVYVDWRNSVFPDELDDPHVSVYGSVDDLEQATGNVVEPIDTLGIQAAKVLVDGVEADDIKRTDGEPLVDELPTVCRMCDIQTRIQGSFFCPGCHPEIDESDFDGDLAASATAGDGLLSTEASHHLTGFDSVREAAHHVRRVVERRHQTRGQTVDVESRPDGNYAVLIRDSDGGFRGSVMLKDADDGVEVVGSEGMLNDLKLSNPRASASDGAGSGNSDLLAGGNPPVPPVPDADTERIENLWKSLINRAWTDIDTRLSIQASFDPLKHPRDEMGRFTDRPYDVPDDIQEMPTEDVVRELADTDDDFAEKVSDLKIDGIMEVEDELDDVLDVGMSPAERREGVDVAPVGDKIDVDAIDDDMVGESVMFTDAGRDRMMTVQEVDEDFHGNPILIGENTAGIDRSVRVMDDTELWETEAVPENPDVSIDWSDDMDERTEAVREAIEDWVPLGDDAPGDFADDIPIDQDMADANIDHIAQALATSKDPEIAERTIGSFAQLGDDVSRAYAGKRTGPGGVTRTAVAVSGTIEATAVHETGHIVGKTFGMSGHASHLASDHRGELPDPGDYGFGDDSVPDPEVRFGFDNPDGSERAWGRDDWGPKVDDEIGPSLDGRNFSKMPDDWAGEADEDAMVYFEENPVAGFQDDEESNRAWRIAEARDESDDPFASRELTLENWRGDQFDATVEGTPDGMKIKSKDIYETEGFLPDVQGKRESTPENWGQYDKDPDEILSDDAPGDVDERMERLGKATNEAWYRQAKMTEVVGKDDAELTTIKSNYSATNAHETLAQTHEVMQTSDLSDLEFDRAARALVEHHPEMLDAYTDVFDVGSDGMREALNNRLEHKGADYRF